MVFPGVLCWSYVKVRGRGGCWVGGRSVIHWCGCAVQCRSRLGLCRCICRDCGVRGCSCLLLCCCWLFGCGGTQLGRLWWYVVGGSVGMFAMCCSLVRSRVVWWDGCVGAVG